MKKTLFIVLIALSFIAPLEKTDVAKLQPVEAVGLRDYGGQIIITTDTGDIGAGENIIEALNDLDKNTSGIIYLDTAEYLLVTESMVGEIKHIKNKLKQSVKLCLWNGEDNLKDAVKYLSVHGELPKLKHWNNGVELPSYYCEKIFKNMEISG